MATIVSKQELFEMVGRELAPSDWLKIDQRLIDDFAAATFDDQYIHSDPVRAAKTPLGGTIAHGFLSLSLLPFLGKTSGIAPEGARMVFNYGLNRVRFLHPVATGSRIRLHSRILGIDEKDGGRLLMRVAARLEIEDESTPAMIAETLTMFAF